MFLLSDKCSAFANSARQAADGWEQAKQKRASRGIRTLDLLITNQLLYH